MIDDVKMTDKKMLLPQFLLIESLKDLNTEFSTMVATQCVV